MSTRIDFGLLGPLNVRCGATVVPIRQGKQRVVLAALLLKGGQPVPVDELAEILWGQHPPASARVTIQNHVMRLRKALAATGRPLVSTQPGGYLISIDPAELDISRFESLLGSAHAAARAGSWDSAATAARDALALWRGEPLADVQSEVLTQREVPRIEEMRLQALETRINADLRRGRHAEVISELRRLASTHPLREQLHTLLMLALYRDGRQGEALAAYRHARQVLIEELGSEPGAGLRKLHQQILTADHALEAPEPARIVAGSPGPPVPYQLPGMATHFTGRAAELAALTKLVDPADGAGARTPPIAVIGGAAGVGKTALAIQWAHQAAALFPDGQLYVNLRGYDPDRPVAAAAALAGFLRELGVAGQDVPPGEDERAARYRSLLTGRRMLVVLDNAAQARQVRPLLPGTAGCAVLVTSRDSLTGLVAREGALRLDLDVLPLADAVGLLGALIGGRVAAEPEAAAAMAAHCSRMPLALRVAAELAGARPAVSLAELVGVLSDEHRRLDLLNAGGDPYTAVRGVFSWSLRYLDNSASRAFRLLGFYPGAHFDAHGAAALAGIPVAAAHGVLSRLASAHLIRAVLPGRYGMHDLLAVYARELEASRGGQDGSRAALTRLFDYYLHTAAAAMGSLFPAGAHRHPRGPEAAVPAPQTADATAARAWLNDELANLVATAQYTCAHGWPEHTIRLAETVFRYLQTMGNTSAAVTICTSAHRASRLAGERGAGANTLTGLAAVDCSQGRCQRTVTRLQQTLALYWQAGDPRGRPPALHNLGLAHFGQGFTQQPSGHFQQALMLYQQVSERLGQARALSKLGCAERRIGRCRQAAGHLQQALGPFRELGDRLSLLVSWRVRAVP